MNKVAMAVIGVGNLGAEHARIYSKLNSVDLVGACDVVSARARKIARRLKTHHFTDYRDLLDLVDAVSVCVPTKSHYQIAKDFLLRGVHTLIEKPITITLKEADELLELARAKNLALWVGHVERFNSAIKALKELSKQPRFIEVHRLGPFDPRVTDIGVVLDLMIHDLDIVLDLVNSEMEELDAVGARILTKHEDIANARIRFKNGCCCNLTASRLTRERMRKIRIFQENAYISLDYLRQSARIHRKIGSKIVSSRINIKKEEPLKGELEEFVNCILKRTTPFPIDQGARNALEIALKIVDKIECQLIR